MTPKDVTAFAMRYPEVTEEHPFGDTPDVYKVAGRIFVLLMPDAERPRVSLKCDPEFALLLRARYAGVVPGYHLNKRHWNTVELDGSIPADDIEEMIHHSYNCVIAKLTKIKRAELVQKMGEVGIEPDPYLAFG